MNYPDLTEENFISNFPQFENADNIDLTLQKAVNYFDKYTCFCNLVNQYMVFLLTAHLLTIQDNVMNGDTSGGIETGASIDKISITHAPPPYTDSFDYWLGQTVYGQELLAFINIKLATPRYTGGSFVRVL